MQIQPHKAILSLASAALIAFALASACASGHHTPFDGVQTPQRDLSALQARLTAVVGEGGLRTIGQVSYDGFSAPIWHLSLPGSSPDRPRILIDAGIHGNEPAGVDCVLALVEARAADPRLYNGAAVDIIPVVNPWGWVHDIRFNRDGIDINRDFVGRRSQEARLIAAFLKGRRYELIVDLHEDPDARGFYLYQYGVADKSVSAGVVAAVRAMGYPIEEEVSMVVLKTVNGVIDAPMWGLWYMYVTGQLSLANYNRLHHSDRVYTVETPTRLAPAHRLRMHQTALDLLLAAAEASTAGAGQ